MSFASNSKPPWQNNESPSRLAEKPSKRDVRQSMLRLLKNDECYQLNSGGRFDGRDDYLRLDNTHLTPREVAEQVMGHFGLHVVSGAKRT